MKEHVSMIFVWYGHIDIDEPEDRFIYASLTQLIPTPVGMSCFVLQFGKYIREHHEALKLQDRRRYPVYPQTARIINKDNVVQDGRF